MRHVWIWAIPAVLIGAAFLRRRDATTAVETKSTVPGREADDVGKPVIHISRASAERRQHAPEEVVTLLDLAREGTSEACETLAQAIRDPRDHARASDAVGALARFPTETAVNAFQALLRESETHLVRLRSLQGLVLMIRWTPRDSADPASLAILGQARTILLSEGLVAAGVIERESAIAAFRHEARQIGKDIETLVR